jgi:ribosomal protein S15P/S13E
LIVGAPLLRTLSVIAMVAYLTSCQTTAKKMGNGIGAALGAPLAIIFQDPALAGDGAMLGSRIGGDVGAAIGKHYDYNPSESGNLDNSLDDAWFININLPRNVRISLATQVTVDLLENSRKRIDLHMPNSKSHIIGSAIWLLSTNSSPDQCRIVNAKIQHMNKHHEQQRKFCQNKDGDWVSVYHFYAIK